MRLEGKKALITGASRGIGKAIALAYAREGADIAVTSRTTDALTEETYDYVMDINLKALVFISRAAAKLMEPQKSGIIINLSSDAGMRGAPSPYGISKWGVIGFTKGLATEMAPHGVRVNAIAPGPVATNMMGCEDNKPKEWSGPLGRFALPDEIAGVALFLASEDSRAVFGHTVVVNTTNT